MNERLYNDDLPQQVPPGWWPCFNVTNEVIPAWACMSFYEAVSRYVNGDSLPTDTVARNLKAKRLEAFGGQQVIRVGKPGDGIHANAPEIQLAFLWFNGPQPILPFRSGICTRLWPVKTLIATDEFGPTIGGVYGTPGERFHLEPADGYDGSFFADKLFTVNFLDAYQTPLAGSAVPLDSGGTYLWEAWVSPAMPLDP